MLHRIFERLMVEAYLDAPFAAALLVDPRTAARTAGYSDLVAESLVGLPSSSLEAFAAALHGRLYGQDTRVCRGDSRVMTPDVASAIRPLARALG